MNLPKKALLGVSDKSLASVLKEEVKVDCSSNDVVLEITRGIRYHEEKLFKQFKAGDLAKAQLGLGHSYSRAKIKFNVNRVDNMIIQAIALLDQMDKDINQFTMRVREWYSWHFPELMRLVPDQVQYAQLAILIKDKSALSEADLEAIGQIVQDSGKAQLILEAAKSSMGSDISELDLLNIKSFAARVISLAKYRQQLHRYLLSKMSNVAPNLSSLIGEMVGARLIAHAGSLTNLAKFPASTVQILGAEKALFRALKSKANTPKYGLIYHSSFIGKASTADKGRISRYLANKCSIASRIDCFSDFLTDEFGAALKKQVDERLSFLQTGCSLTKNEDVMKTVVQSVGSKKRQIDQAEEAPRQKKDKKSKDSSPKKTAESKETEVKTKEKKKDKKSDKEIKTDKSQGKKHQESKKDKKKEK